MNSPEPIVKAIEYLIEGGQKEAACWVMDKLLVDFPDNARLHSEMAALAYDHGDTQTALAHYTQAAVLCPKNAHYLKNLGDFYYAVQKDAQSALAQYEKVLHVDPNHLETLIMAGHVSISLHRYKDAQQYYQQAQALDPHNTEVRQILEKINHPATDQTASPMSVDDIYETAQAKVHEGDQEAAISLLEQLLAQDNKHALAHNDLGVLNYKNGNREAALNHYQKSVDLVPENATFQKNLADFYWAEMGDHQRALEGYVQVLKLDPRDIEAHLSCGQICQALEKDDDARDFFNMALEVEPMNEDARQMLGRLDQASDAIGYDVPATDLYELAQDKASAGELHEAINSLNQLITSSPNNALAHNDLGVLYYQTGDKNKALQCYEQAVQLDPTAHTYRKNLADFYMVMQERMEDAMKLYLQILEENPEDIESLIAIGMVCASLGNLKDAQYFCDRVLEIEPWNETAQHALNNLQAFEDADGSDAGKAAAG